MPKPIDKFFHELMQEHSSRRFGQSKCMSNAPVSAVVELRFQFPKTIVAVWCLWLTGLDGGFLYADEIVAPAIPVYDGYQLIWHDEFSVDGPPDPTRWSHELGFVRNEELQWFQKENAWVADGILYLAARRERVSIPLHDKSGKDWRVRRASARYTSASLTTRGLAAWKYGRYEIRARLPIQEGLWPVIWMLGTAAEWPASGEIDIAESYGGYLLANGAWSSRREGAVKWDTKRKRIRRLGGPEWAAQFHVWRMDWDEDRIVISVDGDVINRINVKRARNPRDTEPRYPFRHPHQLFLTLAVGGTNGGNPDGAGFPAHFKIDYVRIYQRPASRE